MAPPPWAARRCHLARMLAEVRAGGCGTPGVSTLPGAVQGGAPSLSGPVRFLASEVCPEDEPPRRFSVGGPVSSPGPGSSSHRVWVLRREGWVAPP